MKIAWAGNYAHPLPDGHRFPMEKYELLPQQLIYEGTISDSNLFEPEPATDGEILLAHSENYLRKIREGLLTRQEERKTGFPWSKALFEREVSIMGGTIQAARFALDYGASFNIAGGTHHAFSNRGEGFCLLNDQAIAAKVLLKEKRLKKVLIIDLDVHQGNGTAEICQGDERIFTFSMHGEKNYPLRKEVSDLDIELADGTDDATYLDLLQQHLRIVIDNEKPDFAFFQSGVDVLKTDALGRLGMTIEGCKERDHFVLSSLYDKGIPVCMSMGGGYSKDIKHIIEAHANTYRLTQSIWF